jgi:WD40 repeat protein
LLREWYCDHAGISGRVIFAPDGQTLATTNWSGWRLWDVHHGHLIVAGDREVVVGDLAFAPTGQLLAVTGHANQGGQLHLFSLPTGAWLHSFRIPPQRARPRGRGVREPPHLNGVAFSPNGAWLAAGGSDVGNESNTQTTPGHLFVWAVASGQQLAAWRAHTGRVLAVQFTPDGRLISAGADGLLCAWDAPTGTLLQTWTGTPGSAYAWPTITFDAAGRYACGPAWQYLGILRLDTPHRATDCV